jgi:epsin
MNLVQNALEAAEALRIQARGSDIEKRMFEALSGENWGASSSLLNQIASDTYDFDKYPVITKMIWASLEQTGAMWRKVFKGLTLIEHLAKNGNERIVEDTRDRMRMIRTLTDFNYYDGAVDRGSGVREKAKNVIDLLGDNQRVREEREKARQLREKFAGAGVVGASPNYGGHGGGGSSGSSYNSGGIGSYSTGGIGSSSFEVKKPTEGFDHRQSKYSDSAGSGGFKDPAPTASRYSDGVAETSLKKVQDKTKKFDIQIKTPVTDKPVKTDVSVPEPDLFGVEVRAGTVDFFGAAPSNQQAAFATFPGQHQAQPAAAPASSQQTFGQDTFGAFVTPSPAPFLSAPLQNISFQGIDFVAPGYTQAAYVPPSMPPAHVQQASQPAQDFGDFQQVLNSPSKPYGKPPIASNLVDLDSLSLNDKKERSTAADASKVKAHDSFRGLDGFNLIPASHMMNRSSPMIAQQPANGIMMRTIALFSRLLGSMAVRRCKDSSDFSSHFTLFLLSTHTWDPAS